MRSFQSYIESKRREYGDKFDASDLARQFVPYFESGQRVKVDLGNDEILTGTIGVTTGWRPCFLLMRTSRSIGSTWTLGKDDKVVEVTRYQSAR